MVGRRVSKQSQSGFTIVELLIVIVIIGVLAGLVIVTFSGIQSRARDTERQTDIKSVFSHVEAYYAVNGKYPSLAQMNDATWRSTNLQGLDKEALRDPKNTSYNLVSTPATNVYSYAVTASDGSACDNSTVDCSLYTLTAKLESGTTYAKSNLD